MAHIDDQRLAYEVERAIGLLPGVNLNDLRVTVDRGRARIQGVVRTLADKQAAIEAAYGLQGIVAVDEAIAVETPHPPRDADLAEAIGQAMDEDEEVDATRVGAGAARGQAILKGDVRAVGDLARAIETTGEVPNTTNVIDSTIIQNPYGPDQIDLANAVADALRAHPVLRNRSIRPVVEETGKIVLTGQVRAEEEKRQALILVGDVPGVHSVREELQVIP
jgi:osmotically-inducible protein OsmY